jgi:probable F420-dependent oxidoreductase
MNEKAPTMFAGLGYIQVPEALAIAKKAEEVGFGGLVVADHVFMPDIKPGEYPYSTDGNPPFPLNVPWPDVWSICSAVAAITSTIEILTCVYILPLRHPLIVARAAGTAAIIADGRLTVGVGVGWLKEEFDALGVDFSKRGAITNEAIEILRKLWGEGPVTHSGRYFSFGPLFLEPSPKVRIPIVVGGTSDAALRRTVRQGDGYILPAMSDTAEMFKTLDRLWKALEDAGRERESCRTIMVWNGSNTVDDLCRCAEAGVDGIVVQPWSSAPTLQEKLDGVERFAIERILPMHERLGFPPPVGSLLT